MNNIYLSQISLCTFQQLINHLLIEEMRKLRNEQNKQNHVDTINWNYEKIILTIHVMSFYRIMEPLRYEG